MTISLLKYETLELTEVVFPLTMVVFVVLKNQKHTVALQTQNSL